MCGAPTHVRFTPKSGHVHCTSACLLWAKSGLMHRSKINLFDPLVGTGKRRRRNGNAELGVAIPSIPSTTLIGAIPMAHRRARDPDVSCRETSPRANPPSRGNHCLAG